MRIGAINTQYSRAAGLTELWRDYDHLMTARAAAPSTKEEPPSEVKALVHPLDNPKSRPSWIAHTKLQGLNRSMLNRKRSKGDNLRIDSGHEVFSEMPKWSKMEEEEHCAIEPIAGDNEAERPIVADRVYMSHIGNQEVFPHTTSMGWKASGVKNVGKNLLSLNAAARERAQFMRFCGNITNVVNMRVVPMT